LVKNCKRSRGGADQRRRRSFLFS